MIKEWIKEFFLIGIIIIFIMFVRATIDLYFKFDMRDIFSGIGVATIAILISNIYLKDNK